LFILLFFFLSYFLFKKISDLRSCISFRSFLWLPSCFLFYSKVLQKVSIPCLCPKLVMSLSSLECPLLFGRIFSSFMVLQVFHLRKLEYLFCSCNNTTYIYIYIKKENSP
jgi:hypothetical protein